MQNIQKHSMGNYQNAGYNENKLYNNLCNCQDVKIVKEICLQNPDFVSRDNYYVFRNFCKNGDLDQAKIIYENCDIFHNCGIYEYPKLFTWVCTNGHFDVVKWLIEVEGNTILYSLTRYSYALKFALEHKHYEIADYLMKLNPDSIDHLTNLQPISNLGMKNNILKCQIYMSKNK